MEKLLTKRLSNIYIFGIKKQTIKQFESYRRNRLKLKQFLMGQSKGVLYGVLISLNVILEKNKDQKL